MNAHAVCHRLCCAGFHTFDYARHFLSCASRMLGLEHETLRGAISIEYYGRNVGIKIMPTGESGVITVL
jgi:trehalose-6-phosphate synthase